MLLDIFYWTCGFPPLLILSLLVLSGFNDFSDSRRGGGGVGICSLRSLGVVCVGVCGEGCSIYQIFTYYHSIKDIVVAFP